MAALKRALTPNPDFVPAHGLLALIYGELGQEEEARAEGVEFLRRSSLISTEGVRQRLPYKDQAEVERVSDGARKAFATLRVRDYVSLFIIRLLRYFHLRRKQNNSLQ